MGPENLKFAGGVAHTVLNPAVAVVVVLAGLILSFGSRNKAIVAFLVTAFLSPIDEVLVVGSFHFPVIRMLVLFGLVRMAWQKFNSKSEIVSGGLNVIDKAMIYLALVTAVNGMLLWPQMDQLNYQSGVLYTTFGVYFLLRLLIHDGEDVDVVIRVLACLMVVIAGFMMYEQSTGVNLIYKLLGGAHAELYGAAMARDNRFRAAGPFGHPILAGTFGGVMMPLFLGLWCKNKKNRNIALLGMIASLLVTVAANSSTSLMGLGGGLIALSLWPLRKLMRTIRWGILLTLISLHMVMKAPVWNLIARVNLSGGSDSWHRFNLVDQCIRHFGDWWFIGTRSNAAWGWDMWDTADQYVEIAERSGAIPLALFVAIFVWSFKYLGNARKAAEAEGDRGQAFFLWALGSMLFANMVAFVGISYWDQSLVSWYALLAIISTATVSLREKSAAPKVEEAEVRLAPIPSPASLTPAFSRSSRLAATVRGLEK